MTATIRAEDVLARYGGEEFAVICREIDARGRPRRWASGCARRSQAQRFEHAGKVIPVTVSVGAAVERKIDDAQAFIAAADAAMYEAKRTGRNRLHAPGVQPRRPRSSRVLEQERPGAGGEDAAATSVQANAAANRSSVRIAEGLRVVTMSGAPGRPENTGDSPPR